MKLLGLFWDVDELNQLSPEFPRLRLQPQRRRVFRLSAFGHRENVIEAVERIKKNLK